MRPLARDRQDDSDRIGFDVSLLMLAAFVLIVVVLLVHIGDKQESSEEAKTQGSVIVDLYWPDNLDVDVDLWVKGPEDIPVGYSNKGGYLFNLLRDDLGIRPEYDLSGRNMETSLTRGKPEGEYIVNAHLYNLYDEGLPVPVRAVVSLKKGGKHGLVQVASIDAKLEAECEEKTLVRFRLDDKGQLVTGSVHHTPIPLRSRADCGRDDGFRGL